MKKRVFSLLLALCLLTGTAALAVGGVSAEGGSGYTVTVKTDGNGQVSADGNTWADSVDITVADGQKLGNSFSYRANEGYRFDKASLPARINKMVGGYFNFCIIDEAGDLWMVGRNDRGQLTRTTDTSELRKVTVGMANNKVKDVAITQFSLLVLDTSGRVWSAGGNTNGQLGDTRNNNKYNSTNPTFAQVTDGIGNTKIVDIAAGLDHSVLIDENGKVWTAGSNRLGQLGRPENAGVFNSNTYMAPANPTFTQVTGDIANVKAVAACVGSAHTVVLDENGEIWSVGQNGMAGRTMTGNYDAVFTKIGGELAGKKVVSISAGMSHTVLLTEDGEVYGAGTNLYGQLGLPSTTNLAREFTRLAADVGDGKFAYVAAGKSQTYIIDFDSNAYITGFNNSGQIGVPTATTQRVHGFTKVDTGVKYVEAVGGDTYSVLLDANGKLWSAGSSGGAGLILRPDTADNSVFATCTAEVYADYSLAQMKDRKITSDLTVTLRFKKAQVIKVEYILNGGNWIDGFTPPSFFYGDESFTPPDGSNLTFPGLEFQKWTIAVGVDIRRYTAVWTEKKYTINFNTDGGSDVPPKTDAKWYGSPIANVTSPTKAGYDFAGWKYGDTIVTNYMYLKELTTDHEASSFEFVAQWTARSDTPYTVERWRQNADNDEYTKYESESYTGTTGEIPQMMTVLYNGFKAGTYTPTAIAGDGSTVIKVYYDRENYNLTWDANGGTLGGDYTSGSVRYGASITAPVATRSGYIFDGWDAEIPATMPSQNMTLTARWTARTDTHYTVERYQQNINDDGYTLVDSKSFTGTTDAFPEILFVEYTGFESGTYIPETIKSDGSTVIKVYYDREKYDLTWNAAGGTLSGDYTSGKLRYGASITAPTAARAGYDFNGWGVSVPATMPANDLLITARWAARNDTPYTVEHYQQNINDDGYVLADSEPLTGTTDTVANVNFKSYTGFEDGRCDLTTINGDGSTVAKVYYDRKVYTLSWNADGGTLSGDYTSGKLRYGASITAPTAEKKGSKFLGWDAEIPATMPDGDLTITALWQILARMPDRELVIYYKSVGKLNTITDDPSVVAYSSSDESVVTVDQDGTYTAVGKGTAVITMSVPGSDIEEHCTVTVKYAWWQILIRIFLLGFIWY